MSRSTSHRGAAAPVDALVARMATLAAGQHGLITRRQFLATGGTPDRITSWLRTGRLEIVGQGVYRMAGAPSTWRSALMGHCLASRGFASHLAAGHLLGASDLRNPPVPSITIPKGRHYRHDGVRVHTSVDVDLAGVHLVDNIPVCSPQRFLLDMGKVWTRHQVEHAVDDFLRMGLVDWDIVRSCYLAHAKQGRNGCGVLRALLEERYGENDQADSKGERLMLRVLAEAGFPPWELHHRIFDGHGRFVMETDVAWPEAKVCVMFDGKQYHLNAAAFERDKAKRRWATALGWAVAEATWRTVTVEPWTLVRDLRTIMSLGSVAV